MTNLSCDQKNACRSNPLAAYVAKRLPHMLITVVCLNIANLLFVALAAVYTLDPQLFPSAAFAHQVAISLTLVSLAAGLSLALELAWMRRHGISPESFKREAGPAHEPRHLENRVKDMTVKLHSASALVGHSSGEIWRGCVNDLRSFGGYWGRQHGSAENRMHAEHLRSLEIQALALADMIEAGCRSLEEKQEVGYRGVQAGFRQLEMSRETFQRITRIAQAANRTLRAPNRKGIEKKNLTKRNCHP